MANEKARSLSDVAIQKLKQPEAKKWVRDGGGLALCLSPSKASHWRHWYFIYTSPESGKKCYKPLGSYPEVSLASARTTTALLRADVMKGLDPIAEERRATEAKVRADEEAKLLKEAEENSLTVKGLFDDYMAREARLKKRQSSCIDNERMFRVNIEPFWGHKKASDIKKKDCIALLDSYADRPALCNNVMKLARRMYNFAVEKDLLEHTPFTGVKVPVKVLSRERVLTESEIKKLWTSELPKAAMSDSVRRILKILLLTGQRVGEVSGIRESEVDGRWWTLPPERTKNGQTHRVYLTDTVIKLLGTPVYGFYFPSPVVKEDENGDPVYNHVDENAVAYAIRKNLKNYQPRRPIKGDKISMVQIPEEKKMDIAHFTPHDLRRTFSTCLAQLGFSDEVIDAVTGHKKQGIIKVYNRHKYDEEKRKALEAWELKLKEIVTVT